MEVNNANLSSRIGQKQQEYNLWEAIDKKYSHRCSIEWVVKTVRHELRELELNEFQKKRLAEEEKKRLAEKKRLEKEEIGYEYVQTFHDKYSALFNDFISDTNVAMFLRYPAYFGHLPPPSWALRLPLVMKTSDAEATMTIILRDVVLSTSDIPSDLYNIGLFCFVKLRIHEYYESKAP